MDLFGIKRRRAEREARAQQKREEMLTARKALKASRKAIIDPWLENFEKERVARGREKMEKELKVLEKENSTCPICGSTNRIYKYRRTQGSVDGKLHGVSHGYSSLFGGSSSGCIDGSLHGEMDTLQVNECKDCGNQWPVKQPSHSWSGDYVSNPFDVGYGGYLGYLYRRVRDVIEKNEWPNHFAVGLESFQDAPREVMECMIWKWFNSFAGDRRWVCSDDENKDYDICQTRVHTNKSKETYNDNEYLFQFTDEDWDIFKKILQRDEYVNFQYPVSDDD